MFKTRIPTNTPFGREVRSGVAHARRVLHVKTETRATYHAGQRWLTAGPERRGVGG